MDAHHRLLFPAYLTSRSGIDLEVVDLLRSSVSESFGISSFQKMLKGNHMKRYDEIKLQYFSSKSLAIKSGFNRTIAEFPKFADTRGYGGFYPSAKYLTEVYIKYIALHGESWLLR